MRYIQKIFEQDVFSILTLLGRPSILELVISDDHIEYQVNTLSGLFSKRKPAKVRPLTIIIANIVHMSQIGDDESDEN
jgi:hypothetical protein